jgi:hypothetical protein
VRSRTLAIVVLVVPHDLRVLQFRMVAHQPEDRARPLVAARHRGVARALFLGLRRQRHLALAELEPVVRVLFALLDLVAGELAGRNRVHALDALGGVAVGDGADLERVHFGEIGHLIEGQRGIVDQPHGGRLGHQGCIAHGKSPLRFAHPLGRRNRWSSAMTGITPLYKPSGPGRAMVT